MYPTLTDCEVIIFNIRQQFTDITLQKLFVTRDNQTEPLFGP